MMAEHMSLERAHQIAQEIRRGRERFGAQYNPPYRSHELQEALVRLEESGNWDAPTREEMTKVNRQMAAANARAARCAKQSGREGEVVEKD